MAPTTTQKLWSLLDSKQRRAAVVLLGLMFIGMVLETLGIGIVIPTLAIMTQTNLSEKYPALRPVLTFLGNPDSKSLILYGMAVLVGINAIKAIFLGVLAWKQAHFVFGLQVSLSHKLFAGYLRQPYPFHLQRNSAQLIRNTIGQVADVTTVIQQTLMLLTEVSVLIGVSILLVSVEPVGAILVVSTLGIAGWGFNHFTRGYILRWGEARQYHEGLRLQHLQQGLGGAKDVKLLGRESDFLAQYQVHNVGTARVGQRQTVMQALPRLWLELLAIVGLAALVMEMIALHKPLESILPTIGLFAAAAFRLMPSVNRTIGALQGVRFSLPVINSLHDEFELLGSAQTPPFVKDMAFKNEIKLQDISFQYAGTKALSLSEVSLVIPRGASVGFIGGSGAGKSTLIDVVLGLLTPSSGQVLVDNLDIQSNLRGWQNEIGYVPQSIFLTDDTLRRNVAFGLASDQIEEAAVWSALKSAQLEQFVKELPQGLNTVVGERGIRLSGGQRQRIGIARALYHNPSVLVLDEATSSLDTATEQGVMDSVRALHGEKTTLIVAHRLSTIEHCDYVFQLERGRIVKIKEAA